MAEDSAPAQRLRDLRDKLCMLLEESDLYDARHVLERIGASELWDEQVVLHSKVRGKPYESACVRHLLWAVGSVLQGRGGVRWTHPEVTAGVPDQ